MVEGEQELKYIEGLSKELEENSRKRTLKDIKELAEQIKNKIEELEK